ncbi:ammonium transporter [Verminephrobacter aporrectodeae]|uniref:ammonium transporter n=1 Tax=Verminephrobacter aporrectodeae TaxID=1110389 RepID=UPI002238068B|nr:ammonium transporter [Verminephrobacter aporrectodeae]MCW5222185.1 ammonium transporter [Verminephrobacter aporrectodeae subsp. tuberculatae]MCW5287649.1 ammonium transporter [Verminephrobacter aporrectodeae subsp. tuberculatae]MCW8166880.1 ammonium transporter [Verminephrobacter aporrectodeae subsp. tuberculatae]MCW8168655.1 ammonium transporter [Verminephrobacter aporrectodeae subsp. tuberculatae]MCW8174392.1 ammonium transporter [Verminephrobacter aporrectodeae subsp. tuberculatae]
MKKMLASCILGLGLLGMGNLSLAQAPAASVAAPAATAAAPASDVGAAAAAAPAAAEAPALVPNKGDTAWMLTATLLVILMVLPGLALFYGGLVRSKNMLSVLMQVMVTFSLVMVLWFIYGYSLAFTEGGPFIGGLDRLFMRGIWDNAAGTFANAATFSKGVVIPEVVFAAFQATFAGITCTLIVGAFAERIKFSAVMLFMVLWFSFSYLPIAHMVWFWMGPDAYTSKEVADAVTARAGQIWQWGALDFAGGTVVHINAAVAGLVGAFMVGKRIGYGREAMAPHSLTLTMVGASLLWVGWFGFNAGSALEANGFSALAFINTLVATSAAVLAWCIGEALMRGKASMLGAASGAVAGLVAITPAAGNVGIGGALVIGFVGGFACLWGVNGLKRLLGADDSLDVFGVHGIGGIVGALLTGVFNAPGLGGPGYVADWVSATAVSAADYSIAAQVWVQAKAVLLTIVWSGVVSFVAYKIVDLTVGLRVTEEDEREGLDITSHGETAYNR